MGINSFPPAGGAGGYEFPSELIDPVSKFRVSNPENLIDTDFEYGLQPTKWETVELINNTPSFFSKSGDTTIDGISSIITNAGTREIIVKTELDHGLAVGIPINVTGTKSITADGSYIINSIPDTKTFTYLCKDDQDDTASILDLYSSIITGEFFQGSQLRVSDSEGIITDAEGTSELTVTTNSTHGFGTNTPFYFLNLNSTVAQEFQSANTASKTFDASNSATAQTFDGSNTLSSFSIDWSNSAVEGGTVSDIASVNLETNSIVVNHTTENFANLPVGTPLYHNITSATSGYFQSNPRGVVFLKTAPNLSLGTSTSQFQVSLVPDGDPLSITTALGGTFQRANQARTFAGNNSNPLTQTNLDVLVGTTVQFDGANQGYAGTPSGTPPDNTLTISGYSGTTITATGAAAADYYIGSMVRYTATGGTAPAALVSGNTYFVKTVAQDSTTFTLTIAELPDAAAITISGGTATTQTLVPIGISIDKNIVHAKNSSFVEKDMVQYSFPEDGAIQTNNNKLFYFVSKVWDAHNFLLSPTSFVPPVATGGVTTDIFNDGQILRVHAFTTGTSTFSFTDAGTSDLKVSVLVVGGGAGGSGRHSGGGGAGGLVFVPDLQLAVNTNYTATVGAGGATETDVNYLNEVDVQGKNSVFGPLTALGGGRAGNQNNGGARGYNGRDGGSGGGGNWAFGTFGNGIQPAQSGQSGAPYGFGNRGGANVAADPGYGGGGGGGAGTPGTDGNSRQGGQGGDGLRSAIIFGKEYVFSDIFGSTYGQDGYFAGGGGGGMWSDPQGTGPGKGGAGGGGQGGYATSNSDAFGRSGLANTGGGGGGGGGSAQNQTGGLGGSGIVLVSYPITEKQQTFAVASGGSESTHTDHLGITWKVHRFTNTGSNTFTVQSPGNFGFEYLLIGGGGAGGIHHGGGGGGGGFIEGHIPLTAQSYNVVVGAGGVGNPGANSPNRNEPNGQNTTAFGLTALGGGGGGSYSTGNGAQGGSAGGAQNWVQVNGQQVPIRGSQGNMGGHSLSATVDQGGGGGGAGSPGSTDSARRGGIGRVSYITGSKVYYAGGGGSANYESAPQIRQPNELGGGGSGGVGPHNASPPLLSIGNPGVANTGGGGGGAGNLYATGANGGSGVAIVRYPIGFASGFPGLPGGIDEVNALKATGGNLIYNIYQNNNWYKVHAFTSTGSSTFSVSSLGSIAPGEVEYLIVGGGGGGGAHCGGGGGAGGFLTGTATVATGSLPIVVGAGGARGGTDTRGNNGSNSTALGLTAFGGGGGGTIADGGIGNGNPGGSGGGAGGGQGITNTGGAGTAGQGFRGGNSGPRQGQNNVSGAGGGGAGGSTQDRSVSHDPTKINGGPGLPSSIMGPTFWFAGGGGSGTYQAVDAGDGGRGGGGGGSSARGLTGLGNQEDTFGVSPTANGTTAPGSLGYPGDGVPNSGGGGGGGNGENSSQRSSAGGSGIVVIRYRIG